MRLLIDSDVDVNTGDKGFNLMLVLESGALLMRLEVLLLSFKLLLLLLKLKILFCGYSYVYVHTGSRVLREIVTLFSRGRGGV